MEDLKAAKEHLIAVIKILENEEANTKRHIISTPEARLRCSMCGEVLYEHLYRSLVLPFGNWFCSLICKEGAERQYRIKQLGESYKYE